MEKKNITPKLQAIMQKRRNTTQPIIENINNHKRTFHCKGDQKHTNNVKKKKIEVEIKPIRAKRKSQRIRKQPINNLRCKFCGTSRLWRSGFKLYKGVRTQRYQCKECRRKFCFEPYEVEKYKRLKQVFEVLALNYNVQNELLEDFYLAINELYKDREADFTHFLYFECDFNMYFVDRTKKHNWEEFKEFIDRFENEAQKSI